MHDAAVAPACFPPSISQGRGAEGCYRGLHSTSCIVKAVNRPSSPHSLQGDGNIRYYEIGSEKPYLSYLMEFRSPAPQKGLGKDGSAADPLLWTCKR